MQIYWPDLRFGPINLLSMPRLLETAPALELDSVLDDTPQENAAPKADAQQLKSADGSAVLEPGAGGKAQQ